MNYESTSGRSANNLRIYGGLFIRVGLEGVEAKIVGCRSVWFMKT